jgi:hypothetical protein
MLRVHFPAYHGALPYFFTDNDAMPVTMRREAEATGNDGRSLPGQCCAAYCLQGHASSIASDARLMKGSCIRSGLAEM